MAKIIARQYSVGIAKEATRGTANTTPTYWLPFNDLSLDEKQDKVADSQAYALIEDSVAMLTTKQFAEGQISGNIHDTTFGLLLFSTLGTLVSHSAHSGESIVYDNKFSVAESTQHQSLTYAVHDPATAQDYTYANGVITKLEISLMLKQFLQYTAGIKALTGATISAFTPATTSENRFVPQYATLNIAQTYAGLQGTLTATGTASSTVHVTALSINTNLLRVGMTVTSTNNPAGNTIAKIVSASAFDLVSATTGVPGTFTFGPAVIKVKSAKVTINKNVEDQEVIGSTSPADFLNKEFTIEGQVECIWQNETDFKTPFMANQQQSMNLDIKNTDVTLGSSTNPELIVTMPKVYITELSIPKKVKDLVYQTIKFRAVYDTVNSAMILVTLTNLVNGY